MPLIMHALVRSLGQERTRVCLKSSEAFVAITMGGTEVDFRVIIKSRKFLKEKCIVGLCSLEKGGATSHKHFRMVAKGTCTRLPVLKK